MEKPLVYLQSLVRAPVVVVLGHVDHGKTTLLDYIRRTRIAQKEAGGITQGIGASVVTTKEGKNITFIDTPGHATFSNMRSQGAKIADIAILVVAADDGVKPQTREALEHILACNIPFVVAATKMDLPGVTSQLVKSQLEKEGVLFEGSGGEVPLIEVSAKVGSGIDNVLEMITLLADLKGISGNAPGPLEAVIFEVGKDKRGATASVIVKNGSLKVGDYVITQDAKAKVRALFDYLGKPTPQVLPGEPCLILGFDNPPLLGSNLWHENQSHALSEKPEQRQVLQKTDDTSALKVILKAKTSGSLDAIIKNIPTTCHIVSSSVGDVNESDIFLAKVARARIFTFEINVPQTMLKLAQTEGIDLESFDIVYKLFERITEILKKDEIKILGKAKIVAIFPFENKKVAGCKVVQGMLSLGQSLTLLKGDKEVGKVKVLSIKKQKTEVPSVKEGEECGILFVPQLDFEVNDVLISVGN